MSLFICQLTKCIMWLVVVRIDGVHLCLSVYDQETLAGKVSVVCSSCSARLVFIVRLHVCSQRYIFFKLLK